VKQLASSTIRLLIVSSMFVSMFLLASCTSSTGTAKNKYKDTLYSVSSFKDSDVLNAVKNMEDERVLYVFDIDNTTLTHPKGQFIGSDQWYHWQENLSDGDHKKVKCRLQMQGVAYYMAQLESTEMGFSALLIDQLQTSGKPVIALTARSPQFRYPTERELRRNGIDFSKSLPNGHPGLPSYYYPMVSVQTPKPRNASYQNGIAMLAGQHKGAMLVDLINRIGATDSFDYVVFFDDRIKNAAAMMDSFVADSRTALVFHYQAVDTDLSQYDLEKAIQGQEKIDSAFRVFQRSEGCDI
jgi:hypothetical protein